MNPLDQYPKVRKALYVAQWVITGIQTVLSALFAFSDGAVDNWPRWFLGTLAVTPVAWAYLGLTASGNVQKPVVLIPADPADPADPPVHD